MHKRPANNIEREKKNAKYGNQFLTYSAEIREAYCIHLGVTYKSISIQDADGDAGNWRRVSM